MSTSIQALATILLLAGLGGCAAPAEPVAATPTPAATPSPGPGKSAMPGTSG